jgi:CBS domain containing-hemolysin-like protein
LLLWIVYCLSLTAGLLALIYNLPALAAFLSVTVVVVTVILLQTLRLTVRSAHFAVQAAPAINWLLTYLHTPLDTIARQLNRFRKHAPHSGLYEKEDILDLLDQQKEQPDNRIAHHDLQLLARATQFDDRQAADIVLPMSRVKLVKLDDHIGPVLLGELHESGQNSFLVYDESPDHVVGTLFLRDAVIAKEGGQVRSLMHPRLCFVHEDFTLRQVLRAFASTGQFMVVVVNSFEEPVGVITLAHLMGQLIGDRSEDDFDAFENRAAVAAWKPQPVLVPVETDEPIDEMPQPDTEVAETESASQ